MIKISKTGRICLGKSSLYYLFMIVCILLAGCVRTYESEQPIPGPPAAECFDYDGIPGLAKMAGDKKRDKILSSLSPPYDPNDYYNQKANGILNRLLIAYAKWAHAADFICTSGCEAYSKNPCRPSSHFHFLGNYNGKGDMFKRDPKVIVIREDNLSCAVLPNNEIIMSSAILDPESPVGAQNESQAAGFIAHELSHALNGDICYQQGSLKALEKYNEKKTKEALSQLTRLLVIFSHQYEYKGSSPFVIGDIYEELIEYRADFMAVFLMLDAGYNPREYLSYLRNVKKQTDSKRYELPESKVSLESRIQVLEWLLDDHSNKVIDPTPHFELCIFWPFVNKTMCVSKNADPWIRRSILYWIMVENEFYLKHYAPEYIKDDPERVANRRMIPIKYTATAEAGKLSLIYPVFQRYPNAFHFIKDWKKELWKD